MIADKMRPLEVVSLTKGPDMLPQKTNARIKYHLSLHSCIRTVDFSAD